MKKIILSITILITGTCYSQNQIFVSTTGNNSAGDGSITNPYGTIKYAGDQAMPGDTVFVRAGTYQNSDFGDNDIWTGEPVARLSNINGTTGNYITFIPYQNEQVVIEFDGIYGFLIQNSSYIQIQGFIFDGIADNITQQEAEDAWGLYKDEDGIIHDLEDEMGINITDPSIIGTSIDQPNSSDNTIEKPIEYNGRALVANKSHHIELIGNTIRNVPSAAIRAQQSDYITITKNKVYDNTFWTTQGVGAITISEATVRPSGDTFTGTKIVITENEVYQNENRLISWNPSKTFVHFEIDEGTGIFLTRNKDTYTQGEMLIANNLSYKNGASGIVCHHTNNVTIEHNTVFDNGTTNHGNPGGIGVNASDEVKIFSNISYSKSNKWALGILAEPVTNLNLNSNIVFNNSGTVNVIRSTSNNTLTTGFNEIDPLFIGSENRNFSLKLGSNAINPIDNNLTVTTNDFYGNSRDNSPDIGAIEYFSPFYVNPTNGDDNTADGSRELPYKNIDYAVEQAVNAKRNLIHIVEGVHYVESTQTITSKSERELIIEGEPNKEVKLLWNRLTGIIIRDANYSNPELDNFPTNITIQNLHFEGRADKIDHYTILAEHVWFQTDDFKNNIRGCATAINIFEGVDVKIDNNIFRNFWQKAVNIKDGRYVTVSNNIVSEVGLTSLTGGVGIAREQNYGSFDDDDDPNKFRWDIRNNLVFNVYQRIYSWVEKKGFYNMVIDEGKPIATNETPNHELGMKARIHNNLIAFTTVDAMVFKSTPNLTISNNSIYVDEDYADGFTDRDKTEARYADDFPNFVFRNNIAHTKDRSEDENNRRVIAIGLNQAAFYSSNITVENNFAYGGDIRPNSNFNNGGEHLEDNGAAFLENPPFVDPVNGDFSLTAGVPSTAGAQLDELEFLFQKASSKNIETKQLDWKYNHLKSVQTLIDNIPGLYDDVTANETIFTTIGVYDISDKEGVDRKSFYLIPSDDLITRENITDGKLNRPNLPQYNGYYEIILHPSYSQWYDTILENYTDNNGDEYAYIRNGESVIRQDFNMPSYGLTVFEIEDSTTYDITESNHNVKLDGDLLIKVDSNVTSGIFDLITSTANITSNQESLFNTINVQGFSGDYSLEIINTQSSKVLRLTLGQEEVDTTIPVITSTTLTPSGPAFADGDAIATFTGTGVTVSQGEDFYQISGNDVQLTAAGATSFNSGEAFPLLGLSDASGEIFLVSKRIDPTQDLSVRHNQVNDSKSILIRRIDGSQTGYGGGYLKFEPSGIATGTGDQVVSARLNITTDSTGSNAAAGDLGLYQLDYAFPSSPSETTTWLPEWTEENFNFGDRPYQFATPLDGGSLQPCFISSLGSVAVGAAADEKHSFDVSPIAELNGNFTLMLHSGDGDRHYIHSRTADIEATHPYLSVSFTTENAITATADSLTVKEGSSNLQCALQLLENDLLLSPLFDPEVEEGEEEHPIVHSVNGTLFDALDESTHQTFVGGFGYQEVPGNHGTLYLREVGQAYYVHNQANVTATVTDTFTYTAEDSGITSQPGTITVTITPDNQAPILEVQEMNFNPAAQTPEPAAAGDIAATFTTSDADGDATEVYWLNEDGASPEDTSGNALYQLNRDAGNVTLTAAGAALVNTPAELPFIPLALYDGGGKSDFESAHPYVALGDVFYIDNTSGNDSNDGLTPATAFKTDEAVTDRNPQFLNPGATVYVVGSYAHETFNPAYSYDPNFPSDPYIWRNDVTTFRFRLIEGTASAPITIKGWDKNAVIFSDSSGSIVIDSCKHIRVIGFHTEGPSQRMSLQTGFDLQFLYRKELADVIPADDRFPATTPANDPVNGTAVTDAKYAYFYRVPYGSTAEDVEHDYSVSGDLEKISQIQRPAYTDTKGILVRNSQYVDVLRNHVEFAASTGIRAQTSEFVRIIGNEVNDCSRKASVGTMGMVARGTRDGIAVLGDHSNLYKIIMADNFIHHNFNEIYSWVGTKDFITPELDEGKGLSLEWQEDPSWNQVDSDGRILLMNNVTWLNAVSGVNNHGGDRVDVVGNTSFMNSTYSSLFGLGNRNNIGITHEPDQQNTDEIYGTDVRYWNNLAVTIKGSTGFAIRVNSTSGRVPEGFVTYDGGGNIAFGPDDRKLDVNITDGIFVADADPGFLDPENADFRIPEGSPAQDVAVELTAADDWYIPADVLNLDAKRIVRTGTTTDVGGHEAFAPLTGYAAWVREQVSSSTYDTGSGLAPTDDLDGDGIVNLMEYALGTLAEIPDADVNRQAQLTVIEDPVTGLQTLSYSRPDPARIDVSYEIQESSDLDGWSGISAADFSATEMVEGSQRRFTWKYDADSSLPGINRFYRLMLRQSGESF